MNWLTDLVAKVSPSSSSKGESGGFVDMVKDVITSLAPSAIELLKSKTDSSLAKAKKKLAEAEAKLAAARAKSLAPLPPTNFPADYKPPASTSSTMPTWLPIAGAAVGALVLAQMLRRR